VSRVTRLAARWATPLGQLSVFEPSAEELAAVAGVLAGFYNEPTNSALLGNTTQFTSATVVDLWQAAATRSFLFARDGEVVGDGDFRSIRGETGEVALLVGPRDRQGIGLGSRFLVMLLAVGFTHVGLSRVVASIQPGNRASLRLFERAGFEPDGSPEVRAFADEPDDLCLAVSRASFLDGHRQEVHDIEIEHIAK
jgi:RimJ/RimL family protein N-acetyltransferase